MVIDLNTNQDKYHYWSNSCGETHHWGQYDIKPEELPRELKRAFDELFWENKFGLNCYLTEYDNEYGISFEAIYDSVYAKDIRISYEDLIKCAIAKANKIANRFPQYKVLFGKDVCEWNNGSKESVLAVFMPWNISGEEFDDVGHFVGNIAYSVIGPSQERYPL